MNDFKLLIKNWGFWVVVYSFIVTIALIWVSVSYSNHECPKPTLPEISKKHQQQIKTVYNATSKDIDSLTMELFGFKPAN